MGREQVEGGLFGGRDFAIILLGDPEGLELSQQESGKEEIDSRDSVEGFKSLDLDILAFSVAPIPREQDSCQSLAKKKVRSP